MRLHDCAFATESWRRQHGEEGGERNAGSDVVDDVSKGVGAYIMGRRMFGGGGAVPVDFHDGASPLAAPQNAGQLLISLGSSASQPEDEIALIDAAVAAGVPSSGLDHLFSTSVLAETTATVEQLTGRPPRSATDWLEEHLAAFSS